MGARKELAVFEKLPFSEVECIDIWIAIGGEITPVDDDKIKGPRYYKRSRELRCELIISNKWKNLGSNEQAVRLVRKRLVEAISVALSHKILRDQRKLAEALLTDVSHILLAPEA